MKIVRGKFTPELKKIVRTGLDEYSIEKIGRHCIEEPISFCIEDEAGEVVASIICEFFLGALHIMHLWTHKKHRSKGYASKLMQEVLDFAKTHKCSFVFVETLSFQAPDFYRKFGFEVDLARHGHSNGVSLYYMKKTLG